jgi:single-stranded-DNA-specific exonuclease
MTINQMQQEKISINGFFWKEKEYLEYFKNGIAQKFNLNPYVSKILASKFNNFEQIELFLKPMILSLMPNPMHLKDMDKAIERIYQAIQNKEKISVFGDYDVDGATSTALLSNYFSEIGILIDFHIPDRIKEGYGPNESALKNFKDSGSNLCILVDCGSVAYIPLSFAKSIGLDIIVLDHHLSCETLPDALALINPNRFDQDSPCKNLAAVGIVFLMLVALNSFLESKNFFIINQIKKPDLMKFLDIVALGTVCDVMEIRDLNRAFVKKGLEILNNPNNLGIRTMIQFLNINEKITSYHLGFMFGPRINAGGRIGEAFLGAKLLSSKNIGACYEISSKLNDLNEKRKIIEDIALKDAIASVASIDNNKESHSVCIFSGSWHPGISGILASRIKDIYNLPSIAISFFENENIGKASCRSIPKIDIGASILLAKQKNIILEGGGHKMAAGFSIEKSKISELYEFLNDLYIKKLNECNTHLISEFDLVLDPNTINLAFYNQLKILEPFGPSNPEPKFVLKDLYVMNAKIFGSKHISCFLKSNKNPSWKGIKALCFGNSVRNIGDILFKNPRSVDVMGSISFKTWNGFEYLEFIISDIIVH